MIGCAEPTGTNCNAESPCCASDQLAAPTLTSLDQLSYTNLSLHQTYKLPGYKKMLNAEQKKSRSLRGRGDKNKSKIKSKSESESESRSKDDKAFAAFVAEDPFRYNPWLSPGTAPIADPCGTLGGWDYPSARDYVAGPGAGFAAYMNGTGTPTNVQMPPAAMPVPVGSRGTAALLYDVNMRMQKAQSAAYDAAVGSDSNSNQKWVAGGAQEVSYTIVANHGGRVPCTPVRVSEATSGAKVSPAGSTWTKIGLPPCSGATGGSGQGAGTHCAEPQFTNELTEAGF